MASDVWRTLRANRPALAAAGIIALVGCMALLAPVVQHHDPVAIDLDHTLEGPSAAYWLGTDELGRDQWARLVHGARISLTIGVATQLIAVVLGVAVGMLAGLGGGRTDSAMMRLTDLAYAFPDLLMVILLVSWFGQSVSMLVLAIAFVSWTTVARVVRAQVLSLRGEEFVLAARALGASGWRIGLRHLLPNVLGPVIAVATFGVAAAIFAEAALAYVGAGLQAPTASWGRSVTQSFDLLYAAPHLAVTSCLAIALTMMSFMLVGDALRDALDPKTRGRGRQPAAQLELVDVTPPTRAGEERKAA
jgi:oligopeptide transport system permease protein